MNAKQALAFVERHGIVLQSARGPARGPARGAVREAVRGASAPCAGVPNLAEAVAGEPIRGSWWGHAQGRAIYAACEAVEQSPDVLRCKLVDGKVSYVHRRLWPALARLARRFGPGRLDRVRNEHAESGAHRTRRETFPDWVPAEVMAQAARLTESEAEALLADWPQLLLGRRPSARRDRGPHGEPRHDPRREPG
jgi:hypothetical protein